MPRLVLRLVLTANEGAQICAYEGDQIGVHIGAFIGAHIGAQIGAHIGAFEGLKVPRLVVRWLGCAQVGRAPPQYIPKSSALPCLPSACLAHCLHSAHCLLF